MGVPPSNQPPATTPPQPPVQPQGQPQAPQAGAPLGVGSAGVAASQTAAEQAKKAQTNGTTAQKSLLFSELRDGMIIMADGSYRAVIACQSINFDLMSNREREGVEYSYQNFLNSLNFPIQILVRSQRVDISPYIEKLQGIRRSQDNMLLGVLMDDYIEFIAMLADEANIMDKSFYIVVPFSMTDATKFVEQSKGFFGKIFGQSGPVVTKIDQASYEKAKTEIKNRVDVVTSGLFQLGVQSVQLNTKQLGELYYNMYNPDTAVNQPLGDFDQSDTSLYQKGRRRRTRRKPPETGDEIMAAKKKDPLDIAAEQRAREQVEVEQAFLRGMNTLRDTIAPSSLEINSSYFRLGTKYGRTLYIYGYPREIYTGWLSGLINTDEVLDISMFVYPVESDVVLKNLQKKVTQLNASMSLNAEKGKTRDPGLEAALQDAEELRDQLQVGAERFFRFGLYVTLYADSLEEMAFVQNKIETMFGQQLVRSKVASNQQEQGLNSTIAQMTDQLEIRRNMNTGAISDKLSIYQCRLVGWQGDSLWYQYAQ